MKHKAFFRPILSEAWKLTWSNKGWWFIGLIALFLMGSLSYQLIFQGVQSLANPDLLVSKWQQWSMVSEPVNLLQGQFDVLKQSPKHWFALAGVWTVIGFIALLLFSLSVFALTMIISSVKNFLLRERIDLLAAVAESVVHFKSVFGAVLLSIIVSNVLLLLFSLPIVAFGFGAGVGSTIILLIVFGLFLIASFVVSMISLYTVIGIITEDYTLSPAIVAAWKTLRNHLVVSIEMFLLQILVAVVVGVLLVFFVALLVIPIAIVGSLFVAGQQFNIIASLPVAVLFLVTLGFLFVGSLYTIFHLTSWSLLYARIDDLRPYSRIASYAEILLRI